MSALWHDSDYIPEKRFETPLVTKHLDDFALPSEQHQLPEGVDDPFKKLEAVYDVAAQQMERGIKGQTFLNGKPPPDHIVDPMRHVDDVTKAMLNAPQKGSAIDHKIVESVRTDIEQARLMNKAAARPIATAKNASKTAADVEQESGTPDAVSIGAAIGVFLPMAGAQAVQTVIPGPMPVMVSQAVTVASSVLSAGQIAAAGIAEGLEEDPVPLKRGLREGPKNG